MSVSCRPVAWNNWKSLFTLLMAMAIGSSPVWAQEANDLEKTRQQAVAKGLKYLEEKGQAEDGSFTSRAGAGITALAVTAALRNGQSLDSPLVSKGLKALEKYVQPDGGIYGGGRLKNYETCVAVLAFSEANTKGDYKKILADAQKFLKAMQEIDGRPPEDLWYGGVGYGGAGRPDLSNTTFFVEALRATEVGPDDPAIQAALVFISRCQNLDGEGNDTQFADKNTDGGFYYEIPKDEINPAESEERFTPNGGIRSYGTMSYSGLKSMVFAGLTKNDPRVEAVLDWVEKTYDVEANPGMGNAGLYYYYHTFASALKAAGLSEVESGGTAHDWKADLIKELASRQQEDGSWVNDNNRWFENDPNLATSFALMALSYAKPATAASETDGE